LSATSETLGFYLSAVIFPILRTTCKNAASSIAPKCCRRTSDDRRRPGKDTGIPLELREEAGYVLSDGTSARKHRFYEQQIGPETPLVRGTCDRKDFAPRTVTFCIRKSLRYGRGDISADFAPAALLTTSLLLFNEVVGGVKPREEIDEFFFMSAPYLLLYVLALAVVVRRLHWRLAHGAMAFLAAEVLIVGVLVYRLCEASPEFQYRSSWELSLDGVTLERLPGRPEDSHAQLTIDATVVVKTDGEFVYQFSCLD